MQVVAELGLTENRCVNTGKKQRNMCDRSQFDEIGMVNGTGPSKKYFEGVISKSRFGCWAREQ